MRGHIIDCCSLINLYTGWGSLEELPGLGCQWYLCEAVLNEAEHTREYGNGGQFISVPLDTEQLTCSKLLELVAPASDEERDDYLDFASEVDDGEAQALAIAKHRGYTLLTDDRKAVRLAQREDIAVPIVSTARILQIWVSLNPENEEMLPGIIRRIEELARFSPRRGSTDYEWWRTYREPR